VVYDRAMSRLVFVRHGKASAFSRDDYDRLSEPGVDQAKRLGAHWAELGVTFDRVFVGPRLRQKQTHEHVAAAMRQKGVSWPDAIEIAELDEHHGIRLVFAVIPKMGTDDASLAPIADAFLRGESPSPSEMLSVFRTLTRRWARGELNEEGVETFRAFRRRVERGIDVMTREAGRGASVVAFTSAGAIAAAVGRALDLDDPKVLDLSWSLHNASLSELAFSEERLGLVSFNGTPHLRDASLITSV
jgi:broad specificity phosphatase PhoE